MKILLLAGEESGVMYAEELKRHLGDCEIRGYGDYGFKISDLAVMGVGPVLMKLFYFIGVKRRMERVIDEWRPDVVCTIDYPGMNLKLATFAKRRGIRTVHVVCPQVWAWKRGRIPKIERSIDRLCCFFPFEPELFKPGFATFVGHPLADSFITEAATSQPIAKESRASELKTVALLPGSRLGEIERILPTMLEAVKGVPCRIEIPAANNRAYAAIEQIRHRSEVSGLNITLKHGGAREILRRADCAVVASGTATLEAALARCPTVLVYKVGKFFELLARWFIGNNIRHIGLANVIAEKAGAECPMPELLQQDFTAERVREYLKRWLNEPSEHAVATRKLDETMKLLISDGSAMARIASIILA